MSKLMYMDSQVGGVINDASKIPYGSGSVKSALDGLTKSGFGTPVNLASYTSTSNQYTIPKDGYIRFSGSSSTLTHLAIYGCSMCCSNNNIINGLFVKAGMTVCFTGGTIALANYYPLES